MTLDIARAEGALTGERYRKSLRDGREVWLGGERVDATTHPAFAGMLAELCRLYDLQHSDQYRETMTFVSPETGQRISRSYLLPRTLDDLLAKRRNTEAWAAETLGQMARMPDYCANVMVGLYDLRNELTEHDPRFGENAAAFYRYAAEHDLSLTNAINDPQIDRSTRPSEDPDLALRVTEETKDGIVVRGAKQLATMAPLVHEAFVYLAGHYAQRDDRAFVQWFALPLNTPGVKLICREPYSANGSSFGHPVASRYDEMDCMVIFDDVLVPWERVFLLYDGNLALKCLSRIHAWAIYSADIRLYYRMLTFIGVASMMAEAIGVDGFREIREKIGEIISYAELFRAGLRGREVDAQLTPGGLLAPGPGTAFAAVAAQVSPRMLEIVKEIGASGLIMQPSEADLAQPELKTYVDRYMRGRGVSAVERTRLFRLAWDLVGHASGARQDLYERYFRGDPVQNRNNLYVNFDRTAIVEQIWRFLNRPVPPGSAEQG